MKKTKRYDIGGEIDPLEAANQSEESQAIADEAKGDAMLKAMRDKASAPKPRAKPAMPSLEMNAPPSKPAARTQINFESLNNPSSKLTEADMKPSAPSAPTKAKTSQAGRDAEMAARRERTMGALKSAGSFLADLPGKAMENYRSTRPGYKKQKEKEAAYTGNFSKGGSVSASRRADGIAQRGKTRGKMC
jgi:hypothetical protein